MTGQLLPARSAIAGAVAWGVAVWAGTGSCRDLSPEARFTAAALAAAALLLLLQRRRSRHSRALRCSKAKKPA